MRGGRVLSHLSNILEYIVGVLIVFMTGIVALAVIFRYVIGWPLIWSDELVRYLFIWFCFMGMAVATKNRQHIRVEFLLVRVSSKVRRNVVFAGNLCSLFFLSVVSYSALRLVKEVGSTPSLVLSVPLGCIYMAVLLGALLSLVYIIVNFWSV